ncbi:MAG: HPr kinase [Mucilaginibacter sp.]|nr:HPr kinase [Mucilaginibacter sp.]
MHHFISFSCLTDSEFSVLKKGFIFSVLRLSPTTATSGENVFKGNAISGVDYFLFEYFNIDEKAEFLVSIEGNKVFYYSSNGASPEAVQSVIRGSITKFCLQQQGYFCLHAAGIRIHNRIILFIGQKGAGKSTIASYFHLRGHTVWCDDYCVLYKENDNFLAYQGETSLKINPDTAAELNIPQKSLESVFMLHPDKVLPGEERHIEGKYYFTNGNSTEEDKPLLIAAIFFIQNRETDPGEIIRHQNETDTFRLLMNEIMLPGFNSKNYLKIYFQSVKDLLQVTPIYSIHSPNDITRIHEVYSAVLKFIGYDQANS